MSHHLDSIEIKIDHQPVEILQFIPLPEHSDKMVRLHTIEEIFENNNESEKSDIYLISIKKKPDGYNESKNLLNEDPPITSEEIFELNGKLNSVFLLKNVEILIENKEYSLARKILEALLKTSENSSFLIKKIGFTYELEKKYEEACHYYEKSITLSPQIELSTKLAKLLILQGKIEQAATVFERSLNIVDLHSEDRFDLLQSAGNCWTRINKIDESKKCFLKALEIKPESDQIKSNLGMIYLTNKDFNKAKIYFNEAIASNTKNYQSYAGLGHCFFLENQKRTAHDFFVKSLKINIRQPFTLFLLIRCSFELNIYTYTEDLLEEYILQSPIHLTLIYSLAGIKFHLGKMSECLEQIEKILKLDPNHSGALELKNKVIFFTKKE